MRIAIAAVLAAAMAGQGYAEPGPAIPRMDWLSGYWLSCAAGRETSETWSDMRGGTMVGTALTLRADGRAAWEQMRIGPASGGEGLAFFARPSGQPAAEFRLVRAGNAEAVFENPTHDFPQRVIYRRDGDRLVGRIEGEIGGEARSAEWTYEARPLNARCIRR